MKKIKPLIIFQMDPLGNKIGGIETFVKNFIRYAPNDFEIYMVGVSSDKKVYPVGKWQIVEVQNKKINFLPIIHVKNENVRSKIPLCLKFTVNLALYKKRIFFSDKILEFHRIEPSIPLSDTPCKKILFIHGNMKDLYNPHAETKWKKFPWIYFKMEKYLIQKFNKIFVVREDGVVSYREKYPFMAERFSFLPTWVDENLFFPFKNSEDKKINKVLFLKKNKLPNNSKLILFVGRLEGQKDPLLLIETFKYVNQKMKESILLIVGIGSLKHKMVRLIEKYNLKKSVLFLGVLPQIKVADIMRVSDVFILTSAFEGMPISILEALSSGLPVVTTDVGEVKRVVQSEFSGIVCSLRDPRILGDAVLKVIKSRGKHFSIENCRLSIRKYTVKNVLNRLYQLHYSF